MSITTLNNYSNDQKTLVKMYKHEREDPGQPAFTAGNIRLIDKDTTVGEVTFRRSSEEMVIDELFVKPSFRGRGFGTRLLQLAEKFAAETDLKHIILEPSPIDTMELATLKEWYSKRGYSPYGRNLMRRSGDTFRFLA